MLELVDGQVSARTDDLVCGEAWEYVDFARLHVADDLDEVRPVLRRAERAARAGRWMVGYVTYEAAPAFDSALVVRQPNPGVPLVVMAEFAGRRRVPPLSGCAAGSELHVVRQGGSRWFRGGVGSVRSSIAAGDVYQVNLTDRLHADYTGDPFELYRRLAHAQGGAYNLLIDLGTRSVVCASPELFFTFDDDVIVTRPMKGTARRRARHCDDVIAANELARSEKDRAEHVMIVDLLRNDLARTAAHGSVEVSSLFDIERFETVWQMTSTITARALPCTSVDDVFAALFPCGSVTGAPKVAAMGAIRTLERWPRGVYCGAIGTIGPSPTRDNGIDARFAVAIRTVQVDSVSGVLAYGSGGGITWDSDEHDEDDELEAKAAILVASRPPFELLETMRFDADGATNVERHLARLAASAAYFGFDYDLDEIRRMVTELDPVDEPHRLRLVLGLGGRFQLAASPLAAEPSPVRLAVSSLRVRSDDPLMCHKTTFRDLHDTARAERDDVDDMLLINERDEVVESTVAAVLFRRGNQWWTPPLTAGGLASVGRQLLLDRGEIRERALPIDELDECEAFELVSSLRGRRPAVLVR